MAWTLEKQRRSTVDWHAIVPDDVARKQIVWERHMTVFAMQQAGITLQAIADTFGISRSRIGQMQMKAKRLAKKGVSPVERYHATLGDIASLADDCFAYGRPIKPVQTHAMISAMTTPRKSRDWLFVG